MHRALLLSAVVLPLLVPAALALDAEAGAREFLRRAALEEERGNREEARGWYRAASACYRHLVLPVRLAQMDYLHEKGVFPARRLETRLLRQIASLVRDEGFLSARERVAKHYRERADAALERARLIELDLPVRTAGLVPVDSRSSRDSVEQMIIGIIDTGVYDALLAYQYAELEDRAAGSDRSSRIREVREEWTRKKNHVALAEAGEYSARIAREASLAYFQAALEELARSNDTETRDSYQRTIEALEQRIRRLEKEALHHYLEAAMALEHDGQLAKAIALEERARRLRGDRGPRVTARPRP